MRAFRQKSHSSSVRFIIRLFFQREKERERAKEKEERKRKKREREKFTKESVVKISLGISGVPNARCIYVTSKRSQRHNRYGTVRYHEVRKRAPFSTNGPCTNISRVFRERGRQNGNMKTVFPSGGTNSRPSPGSDTATPCDYLATKFEVILDEKFIGIRGVTPRVLRARCY